MRACIDGGRVIDLVGQVRAGLGAVDLWLRWYETLGADGLRADRPPGGLPGL